MMSCARARVAALALVLASTIAAPPARAGASPFPPIAVGPVPTGTAGQHDITVPLTIPFSSIPASFDAVVLYVAPDLPTEAALNLLGFTSPLTIGQVKAQMPSAAAVISPPTASFSTVSGGLGLATLGCTATECSWRVQWNLALPGVYDGHLEIAAPSVSIVNGGLLGSFLTLVYPLLQSFLGSFLHYDVLVTAAAPPPSVAVPATEDAAIVLLALLLAAVATLEVARRRPGRD